MRKSKTQRYFVQAPSYEDGTSAKIHKATVLKRHRNDNPHLTRFSIEIENVGVFEIHPYRIHNSYRAALSFKIEYDKQEIERCKRFIETLERSEQ